MTVTATITSKGQITIPREIRKILDSNTVEFDVKDGEVRLRPVKSVAGSLAKYAKGKTTTPLQEIREKVWGEVALEKSR
jgi:AbrB family looped-hinge helix DNA binding protein